MMLNMMLFIFMWYSFFGKIFYLPYSLKEINLDKYYIFWFTIFIVEITLFHFVNKLIFVYHFLILLAICFFLISSLLLF